MKRILALTGMTMAVCALGWAQENTGNRVVVPSRNGSRPHVVEVNLMHGNISVRTGGSDIVAEVPGMSRRPDRNVPPGMHRIDVPWRGGIQMSQTGDTVRLNVGPESEGNGIVLTVPANTSVRLRTTHGTIDVTGVHGEIDAASVHGDVTLTNVSGTVLANTVHGSIRAVMDQVDQSKPLSFITLNGNIDATFPADVRMNLKLKNGHGDIWSDFDVKITGSAMTGSSSRSSNGRLRMIMDRGMQGTINGGGVEANFNTLNGRITIHKK